MCFIKTIAIYQNKGGSGKSTLTTNLASMLALKGKRTLIIDTDSQSNVAVSFGKNPFQFKKTVKDLFLNSDVPKDLIISVAPNLDIIPSDSNFNTLEFDVLLKPKQYSNPLTLLKAKISLFEELYDYVLIDTPPALSLATLNTLNAADYVLIPTTLDSYSVIGLVNLLNTLNDFKTNQNPNLKVLGIVPFKVEKNTRLYTNIYPQLVDWANNSNITIFQSISKSVRASDSVTFSSQPLMLSTASNKSAFEYKKLFEQIMKSID